MPRAVVSLLLACMVSSASCTYATAVKNPKLKTTAIVAAVGHGVGTAGFFALCEASGDCDYSFPKKLGYAFLSSAVVDLTVAGLVGIYRLLDEGVPSSP